VFEGLQSIFTVLWWRFKSLSSAVSENGKAATAQEAFDSSSVTTR
jgi:hypothetical protein